MTDFSQLSTLYISYNGMTEPLVRSQVLSYQQGLAARGVRVQLLTFEKQPPADEAGTRAALAAKGIAWHWLPYSGHLGGKGTARDVIAGTRFILRHARDVDFVHCRSFVPALMAYAASRVRRVRWLYDVRGFWAEEKRHRGRMRNPRIFRLAMMLEARLYRSADAIVALTNAAMDVLKRDYLDARGDDVPTRVIPTCVDLSLFGGPRRALDSRAPRLVYSGSIGAGYLTTEIIEVFRRFVARVPEARLLILTRSDPAEALALVDSHGLHGRVDIRSATPDEVAAALRESDVGLVLTKPDVSKVAMSPTKMAEYLAAGLPVMANGGIGDVAAHLRDNRVGVVLDDFEGATIDAAIGEVRALLGDAAMIDRAQTTADRQFSLPMGIDRYGEIYAALAPDKV